MRVRRTEYSPEFRADAVALYRRGRPTRISESVRLNSSESCGISPSEPLMAGRQDRLPPPRSADPTATWRISCTARMC